MARKYPRFLLDDPQNTKSKGPFIVHLLAPRMVCKALPNGDVEVLELFDDASLDEAHKVLADMKQWLRSRRT